jgi:hypothetical protein
MCAPGGVVVRAVVGELEETAAVGIDGIDVHAGRRRVAGEDDLLPVG